MPRWLLVIAIAAACKSRGDAPAPSPAVAEERPACGYLSEHDASEALGVALTYAGDPTDREAGACHLRGPSGVELVFQVSKDTAAYEFAETNGGEPVAGVGERARWLRAANHLVVSRAGRDVGVTVTDPSGRLDTLAAARRAATKLLDAM